MINLRDYLMGRGPIDGELLENAEETVRRLSLLEAEYGKELIITSGFRPASINSITPHAASKSKHTTCQAADLRDIGGELSRWCTENLDILARIGIWIENPTDAHDHLHAQIVPPASGNRVFRA